MATFRLLQQGAPTHAWRSHMIALRAHGLGAPLVYQLYGLTEEEIAIVEGWDQ